MDFRVDCSLFRNPKWRRLGRRLGPEGQIALFELWGFVREHRPSGQLTGFEDPDIEEGAGWLGESGALLETLLELGFLERNQGRTITVHDWAKHNHWAVNQEHRREIGRRGAIVRWGVGRKKQGSDSKGNAESNGKGNAVGNAPLPPSPLLSSPRGEGEREEGGSPSRREAAVEPPSGEVVKHTPGFCVRCADEGKVTKAASGPNTPGHTPTGLDHDLCAGHLTEWFKQQRDEDAA